MSRLVGDDERRLGLHVVIGESVSEIVDAVDVHELGVPVVGHVPVVLVRVRASAESGRCRG